MRTLVIGAALLALMAPDAYAQQSGGPTAAAMSGQTEPGHYMIFFELDRATLTSSARQVIAQAAQDYQRTGTVQIALAGHADRSASEDYNLRLSERRVEAVRGELMRLGVPEGSIATTATGRDRSAGANRRRRARAAQPPGRDRGPAASGTTRSTARRGRRPRGAARAHGGGWGGALHLLLGPCLRPQFPGNRRGTPRTILLVPSSCSTRCRASSAACR